MLTSELLKNSVFIGIELHLFFLAIIILLFVNMSISSIRTGRKKELSLIMVYLGSALMVITDSLWSSYSALTTPNTLLAYIINLIYFFGSSAAAAFWFFFCINHLEIRISKGKMLYLFTIIPYVFITILYILSPIYGFIFKIEDGAYIRGNLFFLDPVVKIGYIAIASMLALLCGFRKKIEYQRKSSFDFSLFGVPVVICGALQTIIGVDFNCLGVTLGLILIYLTGVTNSDVANTDAIYSLARSYDASYIIDLKTGLMRPLKEDNMHDKNMKGMESMDFSTHFNTVLSNILLPEDKESTLNTFNITNIEKRFKFDKSFIIRYRVKEKNGITSLHMATFVHALGSKEKEEFLLGINVIHTDSLLYERNEILKSENQKLEQINNGIIESVAKLVEARDGGSGEHIVRVRKLSEIIARELMVDYPELNLDEESVKLISSASVLHDIGKIVIPDAILLKPGRLTPEEFEVMKTHSVKGCDMLNVFPLGLDDAFLECALSICRWHHEKYDGKGYPDGLKGDDIPISAQIVSVADCFDALVNERPYKKAFDPEVAFDMILNGECGAFSPKILDTLKKKKGKLLELVRLYR